ASNALTLYGSGGVPLPCGPQMGNIGGFSRTADRTTIILASVDSDDTLCEVTESTGQGNYIGTGAGFSQVNFRTTPDGNYIIVPATTDTLPPNTYAYVYDASTLSLVTQIFVSGN